MDIYGYLNCHEFAAHPSRKRNNGGMKRPARNRGKRLRLEEEFDRDGDVGGDWLSVARGRFVSILLECCHGRAL